MSTASNSSAGILLLDKPSGVTSAKAIARVKGRLKLKKIGHSGTLDPLATGLLVCLTGSATRLASFAEAGAKIYSGIIRFGMSTDTDDIEGAVVSSGGGIPSFDQIRTAAEAFVGDLQQVPPKVSAVKIKGAPAYKLARAGQNPELAPRAVRVDFLELLDLTGSELKFRLKCSKGTYVRSIARDLGRELSCGGCLAELRREESLPFSVAEAKTLEDVTSSDILEWDLLLPEASRIAVDVGTLRRLKNGDERALLSVVSSLDRDNPATRIIYTEAETDRPAGLLVREGARWRFGVNIL